MNIQGKTNPRCMGSAGTFVAFGLSFLGLGLLAGCPSNSTQHTATTPPPVARAAAFQGTLFGGRQPIVGATVTAYASGTTVGAAPTQIGSNVTNSSGSFSITFSPAPRTGQVVYVVAHGGVSTTNGSPNSAIGLMTVAGIHGSTFAPVPETVNINELTTVASTAVLQDYIQFADCSTITGNTQTGTCLAIPGATGLGRMAATVTNLVNVLNGQASDFLVANSQTAGSPLTATREKLDTLASVLAACVNASGPTDPACTGLFSAALGNPSNTLKAAWLMAAGPAITDRAQAIYALTPASPVYTPTLAVPPPATTSIGFWTVGGERYAFTANANNSTLSGFRLGGGALTAIAGSACTNASPDPHNCVATGADPWFIAVDPSGRYVYVVNNTSNNVSAYKTGAGGALVPITAGACGTTPDPHNCVATGDLPISVTVGPTGSYVFVTDECLLVDGSSCVNGAVSAYTIGADGGLTPVVAGTCGTTPDPDNCVVAGRQAFSVAVDPTGSYAYVTSDYAETVQEYSIGAGGLLTAVGNAVATGKQPWQVAVDPKGRYVFVANSSGNSVSAYTIGTGGALTPVDGNPCTGANPDPGNCFAAGGGPQSVAVDPTGRYVYVANLASTIANGQSVGAYTIGAGGVLTPIADESCGTTPDPGNCAPTNSEGPYAVTVDPTGRYVYSADFGGAYHGLITTFTIGANGGLTAIGNVNSGCRPRAIAVDATGRYVYNPNRCGAGVSAYRIGPGGALAATAGGGACGTSPDPHNCFTASYEAWSAALDPTGRYLYIANQYGHSVSAYLLGTGGALTPMVGGSCGGNPDPHNCVNAGQAPEGVALDPTASYAYVANNNSNNVSAYTIAADGTLAPIPASTCGTTPDPHNCVASMDGPKSVAVDPAGHYVYVTGGNHYVAEYTIGRDGALTAITAGSCGTTPDPHNCIAAGEGPDSVTVDPTGHYVYVANATQNSNDVSAYMIGAGGELVSITAGNCYHGATVTWDPHNCFAAGKLPQAVTVDPTGRYVYVANDFYDVSAYTIEDGGGLAAITTGGAGSCGNRYPTTDPYNCFDAGVGPTSVEVDPSGHFVYVTNGGGNNVSVYTIKPGGALDPIAAGACGNARTGTPDPGNCFATGQLPNSIVVGP